MVRLQTAAALAPFSGACRCACGAVRLQVTEPPIARFLCHCRHCQAAYASPFGDPTVSWRSSLRIEDPSAVSFDRKRAFPFAVECGTCRTCRQPVVAFSSPFPGIALAYVPGGRFIDPRDVPTAAAHVFHAQRVADVAGDLPRHDGFVASQWCVARLVLAGLLARLGRPQLRVTADRAHH